MRIDYKNEVKSVIQPYQCLQQEQLLIISLEWTKSDGKIGSMIDTMLKSEAYIK